MIAVEGFRTRGAGACWIGALTVVVTASGFAGVNKWTSLGPDGGFITALVVDPHITSTLYAATASNGVFKSIDAGATWTAISSGLDRGYVQSVVDLHHLRGGEALNDGEAKIGKRRTSEGAGRPPTLFGDACTRRR